MGHNPSIIEMKKVLCGYRDCETRELQPIWVPESAQGYFYCRFECMMLAKDLENAKNENPCPTGSNSQGPENRGE